ncbi:MAG: hypothetical protein CME63_04380 [Halobacteriovoraceae bacterium]|nr:hypothetical protein [Halobacteriovoraceae bacterium]|tara:strand:- start:7933 stop:8700 length:768 start_codon:yes stop_codon:yes gene_type:complete
MKYNLSIFLVFISLSSCVSNKEAKMEEESHRDFLSRYSQNGNNFHVSLTDAPHQSLKEVNVTIKEVLLKIGGTSSKRVEVKIAEGLGQVDLLKLQNGIMLPISDLNLPEGIKVSQIRLVLEDFGNYLLYENDTTCDLKTPSQQKTGLKMVNPEFSIRKGYSYSLVVDFDAQKSVVLQGNGDCLLKPVLKWGGISYRNDDFPDQEEEITEDYQDDSEGEGSDTDPELADCQSVEFDLYDMNTWPEDFVFDDYEHCY